MQEICRSSRSTMASENRHSSWIYGRSLVFGTATRSEVAILADSGEYQWLWAAMGRLRARFSGLKNPALSPLSRSSQTGLIGQTHCLNGNHSRQSLLRRTSGRCHLKGPFLGGFKGLPWDYPAYLARSRHSSISCLISLIHLAQHVMRGRLAYARGDFAAAAEAYHKAQAIEGTLPYQEPPFWYYPVGQSLGAALLAAGKPEEARDAFKQALFVAPGNGWALWGLAKAERALGHDLEARAAEAALDRAWLGDRRLLTLERL